MQLDQEIGWPPAFPDWIGYLAGKTALKEITCSLSINKNGFLSNPCITHI